MPINLTFDESWGDRVDVPLGRGAKYGRVEVNLERLSQPVLQYLFEYGLRQVLNDAMATKTDKDGEGLSDEAIVAKAEKRLHNLYDGVLRSRSEGEPADPLEAECYREAKRTMEHNLRVKGLLKDIPKKTKDRFMFAVNRILAQHGKPEMDEAAYIASVLAGPGGADIKKRARANLKGRELDIDIVA